MKICVSSTGDNLKADVDGRFGRCRYFIFADTETMEFEAVDNPNLQAAGGAGIQSAKLVADKGARAVLTGNVGPNAYEALKAASVNIVTGISGTVEEVIKNFNEGKYGQAEGPSVDSHFGSGQNR